MEATNQIKEILLIAQIRHNCGTDVVWQLCYCCPLWSLEPSEVQLGLNETIQTSSLSPLLYHKVHGTPDCCKNLEVLYTVNVKYLDLYLVCWSNRNFTAREASK